MNEREIREDLIKLIGKTVGSVELVGLKDDFGNLYDDLPILILTMIDGSKVKIIANYGG